MDTASGAICLAVLFLLGVAVLLIIGLAQSVGTLDKLNAQELDSDNAALPQSASFISSTPSTESVEHFDRAIDLLNKAGAGKLDETLKLDVASELALAVNKANAPFPAAYAFLAMMMNEMGKDNDAERFANIALQQNPNEFRAELVKIDVTLKGVQIINLRPGHFVHFESPKGRDLAEQIVGSAVGTILGTTVKSVSTLAQSGWAANTQAKFKSELERLVVIFNNLNRVNSDPNEFIFMGETLIGLGDMIKDVPMFGGRPNLYAPVANANVENLKMAGREKEVMATKHKAEGRLLVLGNG